MVKLIIHSDLGGIVSSTVLKEFHISRQARDTYQFSESLFSSSGNVIFADYQIVRKFAQKMNAKRDLLRFPEQAIRAGELNAMGLIDEILHYVVELYREQMVPEFRQIMLKELRQEIGVDLVDATLLRFVQEFPPVAVFKGEQSAQDYCADETNLQLALEEMLMLWLANRNPAFAPFSELFDDRRLKSETAYTVMLKKLEKFSEQLPPFGPEQQPIVAMLRSPAIAKPDSLSGQLIYIQEKWGVILGKYLYRLLGGLDLIREEEKMRFAFGPGPSKVYDFSRMGLEPERFSADKDWMPNLVLLAKSTLVWLDQLSKKYQRSITRLDQIPDEELDQLARWGFTGLWLIGVWERSPASKKIKQLCGNPEAEASAYSLYDYVVAAELGGEEALNNLKERCWKRGIRLASDMVPNHTGIYSKWIVEHPDWFISLDYSPFPGYSFTGPNLSEDPRIGIYIEDHYYDRTDAAVVFKRVDFATGDVHYIYHGNDGTSMPWNDTAQLNYLKAEVREAVIQTILHVARKFSIIRFDAAMTLTKRHFQRLWFPEPGSGGDIPSRAEHAMLKEQFDQLMPREFWREVVDRVTQEAPDTLLLAEAFWLMEGYFVRTLGMHRVYNSAFMNMLKNEENQKYRDVIKRTIEFNPEILKRYVNFMNNPDEETAVAQFGKGDKYLGVCLMMVTMPGLPMFGHGQVEGFTEKYGMEYRRAYWDEEPDRNLIANHERLIFPLMKKRYLFANVQNFLLYDLYTAEGSVNENVFAYSNRVGNERALVLYNNKFDAASGWIHRSAAYLQKMNNGPGKLVQKSLAEGLAIKKGENRFVIFRDHVSGLEFIRSSWEIHEKGLFVELGAYQYHVFWEFREIEDNEWQHYRQLHDYLNGRGVPSINQAMKELFLQPITRAFDELLEPNGMKRFIVACLNPKSEPPLAEFAEKYGRFLAEVKNFLKIFVEPKPFVRLFEEEIQTVRQIPKIVDQTLQSAGDIPELRLFFRNKIDRDAFFWMTLISWAALHRLGLLTGDEDAELRSRAWMDEWLLAKIIVKRGLAMGIPEDRCQRMVAIVKILISYDSWFERDGQDPEFNLGAHLFKDKDIQDYLQVNRYRDVLWFNKEAFVSLMGWLATMKLLKQSKAKPEVREGILTRLQMCLKAAEEAGYQVERFLELMEKTM